MASTILCILLLTVFGISNNWLRSAFAAEQPRVYVDPPENIFASDVTPVGYEFNVTVKVEGFVEPGVYAHEFKLFYDPTMLNATAAILPPDDFMSPAPGGRVVPPPVFESDHVYVGVSLQGVVPGKTGDGTLYIITLQIVSAPETGEMLSCNLELRDVDVMDPDLETIPVTIEHGYYEYAAPPPPKTPIVLKLTPLVLAARVGDEVKVRVSINEVNATFMLVHVEFKVRYNTTLLETREEWITEGEFLKKFGSTIFTVSVEHDYVFVDITLLTEEGPFPEEMGTLANIKFKAIYIPETLTISGILLEDVILVDVEGNPILYDQLEDGFYRVPVIVDLNGDGKVSIMDIAICGKAFGTYAGHPRWNPVADINGDEKVNIIDIVLVARAFGT